MNKTMFILTVSLFVSLSTSPARAAAACVDNATVDQLAQDIIAMDKAHGPDFFDPATATAQEKIVNRGDDIMKSNLTTVCVSPETAESLVRMIALVLPYDNSPTLIENHLRAFQQLWNSPSGLLKGAADALVKKKALTTAQRKSMLDRMGIRK